MTEDEWKRLKIADCNDIKCYVVTEQPTPTLDDDTVMIVGAAVDMLLVDSSQQKYC